MLTIVTDLDGTILDNGKLSQHTINILKEVQKEHRLVLATGRNMKSVQPIYQQLEMDKYKTGALILLNGLAFYDFKDDEYKELQSFDKKETKKITQIAYCLFFRTTVVGKNERVIINCLYDKLYNILIYIIKHKSPIQMNQKIQFPERIEKIELCGTCFFEFFFIILKRLLKSYEVTRVSQWWIEILPKGTNKLNQLQYLIYKYSISSENLYVFGDGENDIEMLKYTKNSYAPLNALKKAKKVAKNICLSYQDEGVAFIIEKLIKV